LWVGVKSMRNTFGSIFWPFILCCFIFHSCSTGGSENGGAINDLGPSIKIELAKDDSLKFYYETKSDFDYSQLYQDSIPLLVAANKRLNSIDFYRMNNGEKIDSIMLSLDGPNGLPRLNNFLLESDTLFAINSFAYELVLFDLNGIALKRIRVRPPEAYDALLPRYFTRSEILKKGDLIYVFGDPDLNPLDRSYAKGKYAYEINLRTGESRSVFEVPEIYRRDRWMINQYFYRHLYSQEKDGWLFSFEVDDSIRLYTTGSKPESYFAGSRLTGPIEKWNRKDVNSKEAYRYYLGNKSYSKLIFDRKHELYYRFVKHPNEQAKMDKDVDAMWFRGFSVVVLDEDLNWVGETLMKNKSIGEVHISTDSGVYLSYFDVDKAIEGEKLFYRLNPVDQAN